MSDALQLAKHIVNGKVIITKEFLSVLLVADTGTLRDLGVALNMLYKHGYSVKTGWRYGHEAVVVMER